MSVRGRDVAAGVGLGLVAVVGAVALAYVVARPSLPAAIERAVTAELVRLPRYLDQSDVLQQTVGVVLSDPRTAALVGRIAARIADEKLPG